MVRAGIPAVSLAVKVKVKFDFGGIRYGGPSAEA